MDEYKRWYIAKYDRFGDVEILTNAYVREKDAQDGLDYLNKKGEGEGKFIYSK